MPPRDPAAGSRRPPEPVPASDPRIQALRWLVGIVDRLREPDGCPWDREQSEESMAPHVVEEAHELLEAIEAGGPAEACEEAGDVLMNVVLICRIAMEAGRYDLARSARSIADKLVRRHPHVFGDVEVDSAGEVLVNWEAIKKAERAAKESDDSALAGVPGGMPALQRAGRICDKAVAAGFRWQSVAGALAKVTEELAELRDALPAEALAAKYAPELAGRSRERVAHELGDVLLASAYLGRYLGLDPERLCRDAVRRFEERYRTMEAALGGAVGERPLEQLLAAWQRAKGSLARR